MKIPKKIRINGFDWSVEENEKVAIEGNIFGSAHYVKQRIFLDPDESRQKKEQCLLHEVLHVVFWQSGLKTRFEKVQGVTEEEIVQALSFGIYQVLRDNKMLKD